MPESRRRKRKHTGPTGRMTLAALDGEVLRIQACCRVEVVLGVGRVQAMHDRRCPVPQGLGARRVTPAASRSSWRWRDKWNTGASAPSWCSTGSAPSRC